MADFSPAFAHLYANKRMPTAGEVDNGFGCGPADIDLFNGLINAFYLELGALITLTGGTPSNANMQQVAEAVQSGGMNFAVATGTANAWTVAPALALPAYTAGRVLWIKAPATNTSTTVNANVSTLGNRRLKKGDGTDPAVSDLVLGRWYPTIDDGTNICVVSTLPSDVAAQKAIVNLQTRTTSTRVSMTGAVGNSYEVTAWTPASYTKLSATSNIVLWLAANSFTGGATGASAAKLVFGGQTSEVVASNALTGTSAGPTVINRVLTGLAAGAQSIALSYKRYDSTGWTTVFCPSNSDASYLPPTSTATLMIGEVEP